MNLPVKYSEIPYKEKWKVREEYNKLQNGLCYYCKQPLDKKPVEDRIVNESLFPKGFFNHPIHLHHNHDTDMTIGTVHAYCNAVLWEYEGE